MQQMLQHRNRQTNMGEQKQNLTVCQVHQYKYY